MPRYLIIANYTPEGLQGLLQEGGTGRRAAVEKLAESLGGKLESFDYAFGGDDAFVICDLPDNEAAAAVGLTTSASGKVSVRTIPLLSPEDIDAAVKRAPEYRPPGS